MITSGRRLVLLALVACEPTAPLPEAPPPHYVYAPPPVPPAIGAVRGRFGRSQPPQLVAQLGITGAARVPLRQPMLWPVPGDRARAAAYGLEGVRGAIDLIEIDSGAQLWRDTAGCAAAIVGVTATSIVCADASGTRALGLDGAVRWRSTNAFIAMTDARVVTMGERDAVILDGADGHELAHVVPPRGVAVDSIIASCGDAGHELFAIERDRLVRVADGPKGPAIAWSAPMGAVLEIDACNGDAIVVSGPGTAGPALIALARATGKVTGRVDGVRGHWRARDGSDRIEIATADGVAIYARDLAGPPEATTLPIVGELLAARGDRRLVRATPLTAVLLDRAGVYAYFAFAELGAALGERALVGASWLGSPAETLHRVRIPAHTRRNVRLPKQATGVNVPAELRDLPPEVALDVTRAIAKVDTAMYAVTAIALDPAEPTRLYAATREHRAEDGAGIAAVDLAQQKWRWQRGDACGAGQVLAIAVAREVVACAARGIASTVRATSRDGASRWEYEGDNIDALDAAGDAALVFDADRATVLDAATGRPLGQLASDDGAALRATLVAIDDVTWLVSYERGHLVTRMPHAGLLPVWSLRVDGVVRSLARSRDAVLVALDDGDAFRVDLRTAAVTALPGLNLEWRATGDLVTGATAGGPIPAPQSALPPRQPAVDVYGRPLPPRDLETLPPLLWTPLPVPVPLGDSWQYAIYELGGGLRARNDYALFGQVVPAEARGPAGSPLVVASGPGHAEILVLDPRTGDPLKRVRLSGTGFVFGTVLDGTPVAGAIVANPLRAVLF
jgi:hypothetical protein